jgi:hypothetical protein
LACVAGSLITLATIKSWTFANFAIPLYYLLIDSILLGVMLFPSRNRAFPVMSADNNPPQDNSSK